MKKLLLVAILFSNFGIAQNVNIPDANFKAILVNDAAINTNGDNEISATEADAVTGSFSFFNSGISDFTGIEAFTNINMFFSSNNQLTSLDLSANTALVFVRVTNTNSLTSLDVSANTALTTLICTNHNQLTSLSVANGNNTNMSLNTLNNTSLSCIEVDDVMYAQNNYTDVDSGVTFSTDCTALSITDFDLQNSIEFYPNPTTSFLNIKTNANLKSVNIYSVVGKEVFE